MSQFVEEEKINFPPETIPVHMIIDDKILKMDDEKSTDSNEENYKSFDEE
jgi:hypothetical protein